MHIEIHRQKSKLDSLFLKISKIEDIEMQAHWAKYLCVLSSGFIENSIKELVIDYSKKCSNPNIQRFVSHNLRGFQNPKVPNILNLMGSLNISWKEQIEHNMETELVDSINSIVSNRNSIAHGENVGITYHSISKYYQNAIKAITFIEALIEA